MAKPFHELRERLLRAGVAPRHVRRYLDELTDHLADLTAEEERVRSTRTEAKSAALIRLGGVDDLANAMIERRQVQSWCARAPGTMFGLVPAFSLACVWFIALLILWSGWQIFLPGANTPFGPGTHRISEFANVYFQLNRALYFGAPILVGWAIGLAATRQRSAAAWPTIGLIVIAWMGGTAQVRASRTTVPGGFGHIRMKFALGTSVHGVPDGLIHALVILALTGLPYVISRLQTAHPFSA